MRNDGAVVVGLGDGGLDRVLLGWAAEEASIRDASLLVCHVRPRLEHENPLLPGGATQPPSLAGLLLEEAARTARSWFPQLQVSTSVVDDRVVPTLLRSSLDARMLVLGARGSGGFAGLGIGSVAAQVAAHAHCPVAVVRQLPSAESMDVVVGVDGSSHSDETLQLAAAEAGRFGGRLIVIHGYRLPPPAEYGPNAGVDEPHYRVAAEALLDRALAHLPAARSELKIETRAEHGSPVTALLDAAADAAVLVVGARGFGGFAGLSLGSVSQQVLRHAPCTVLIVR